MFQIKEYSKNYNIFEKKVDEISNMTKYNYQSHLEANSH
jgi:hypothetical protein